MKKKIDFVTNSSSVSFIIGTKPDISLKIPMITEVDLSRYIEKACKTLEELKKYWLEERCGDEKDEEYLECQSIINEGQIVYFLHCSDEDEHLEAMLCVEGLDVLEIPDYIKIIQGEGGY